MRGDPPPRREAGKGVAPTISARPTGGGGLVTDFDCDGGLIPEVSNALAARDAKQPRAEDNVGIIPVAHALRAEGFDASEDGTGRGTPLVPIAFSAKDHGADAVEGIAPTLRAGGHTGSHANAGVMPAIAIQERAVSENPDAVSEGPHDTANIRAASGGSSRSYLATPWAVRRLTPRECERLQGFPDDYTLVPYRGRPAADGPRYKALGNSMAVNVMQWIGERIAFVDGLLKEVAGNAGNQVDL